MPPRAGHSCDGRRGLARFALVGPRALAYHAPMPHESRLQQSLRQLLASQRTAALAVQPQAGSSPPDICPPGAVPGALGLGGEFSCLVLHVSALAGHTQAMELHPAVSLLVSRPESAEQAVHALERISIQGVASTPPRDSALWQVPVPAIWRAFPKPNP